MIAFVLIALSATWWHQILSMGKSTSNSLEQRQAWLENWSMGDLSIGWKFQSWPLSTPWECQALSQHHMSPLSQSQHPTHSTPNQAALNNTHHHFQISLGTEPTSVHMLAWELHFGSLIDKKHDSAENQQGMADQSTLQKTGIGQKLNFCANILHQKVWICWVYFIELRTFNL